MEHRPARVIMFSLLVACATSISAQTTCDPNGNVILFTNYDGGPLTINVDQNIPDLRIGIVSYEYVTVNIGGSYAANVTEVHYAGFNAGNNHCNGLPPFTTVIAGAPNATITQAIDPPVTLSNSNGYNSGVICAYSCDLTTNQGGCNTADQIEDYMLTTLGGSLRFHRIQYGCWQNVQNVSAGGNCCALPITTGIAGMLPNTGSFAFPDPATDHVTILCGGADVGYGLLRIMDMTGREVQRQGIMRTTDLDVSQWSRGTYIIRMDVAHGTQRAKLVLQ